MRTCPICGKVFNFIDWANHLHLTDEEREELARRMRAKKEANPTPMRPEAEVFKGFEGD